MQSGDWSSDVCSSDLGYSDLLRNTDEYFRVNNISCVLLYGTVNNLSKAEKDAFENFRNELRSIHIIGFDELLARVTNLLALFENQPDTPELK